MSTHYSIPTLPIQYDLETKQVLKQLAKANRALAELKGVAATIPNENILISSLTLQEARDSSSIEKSSRHRTTSIRLIWQSRTSPSLQPRRKSRVIVRQYMSVLILSENTNCWRTTTLSRFRIVWSTLPEASEQPLARNWNEMMEWLSMNRLRTLATSSTIWQILRLSSTTPNCLI